VFAARSGIVRQETNVSVFELHQDKRRDHKDVTRRGELNDDGDGRRS
jgi:hypothetical protein